ncbi:SIMPL domain-containing protein [Saccharicrinis sp. FJH54]|uniref:SIMPL domain-containing protein n=1 Tax=Saccharicrinis sp. FJH54 TaxID=3344665 RepID=UPI0035D50C9F
MKKIVIIAILSTFLIGCQQNISNKTIVLKASGYVLAEPDQASIDLNLSCVDKNLEKAKSKLINKASTVNDILKKLGIEEKDILTTSLRLNKAYEWRNNSNVFTGYNASSQVHVVIRNLDILGDFYTRFLVMEDLSIGNLTYQHSKIDSLSNEAYLNALENASILADKLLTKLPETNKTIGRISNEQLSTSGPANELMFAREENNTGISKSKMPVSTGNMAVEQTLFVEYVIY